MGFILVNGQPVHTSFLNPDPTGEAPVQVTHTGDGSAVLHIAPNVAYEVFQNGDLVVILTEGGKTVFREFGLKDLAFPSPRNERITAQPEQKIANPDNCHHGKNHLGDTGEGVRKADKANQPKQKVKYQPGHHKLDHQT